MNTNKQLKKLFVDLETTGTDINEDRVCQIGMILPDGREYETLINPGIPIPKAATDIHGITDELVESAPSFSAVADLVINALKEADCFVAYNFIFDFQFLQAELFRAKKHILKEGNFVFIDPYKIFKKMFPHNLSNAYRFYTGKELEGLHTAIGDIRATKEILEKQKERYTDLFSLPYKEIEARIIGDTSILGKWFQTKDKVVYFQQGKYKGEAINESHHDYLKWVYSLKDSTLSEKRYIDELLQGVPA